jgi:hypothetical protein
MGLLESSRDIEILRRGFPGVAILLFARNPKSRVFVKSVITSKVAGRGKPAGLMKMAVYVPPFSKDRAVCPLPTTFAPWQILQKHHFLDSWQKEKLQRPEIRAGEFQFHD